MPLQNGGETRAVAARWAQPTLRLLGPHGTPLDDLTAAVLARLPSGSYETVLPELSVQLARLTADAQRAWPGLTLDPSAWAAHLATHLDPARGLGALAKLDGPGLFLACACLAGDKAAHALLEAQLQDVARPALRRLGFDAAAIDEVLQRTRDHLLAGEPRLARFSGRGSLRDWLRTVCVHLSSDLRREHRAETALDDDLLALPAVANPELDAIRADSKAHFTQAFREAVAALEPRQRALLRLHVVERLGIDAIAPLYSASRATIARWVDDAREALAAGTRARLGARLKLRPAELDSLMTLVRSHLDASIERVLRDASRDG